MTELLKELEAMVCRIAGDAAEVRRTGGDPERERHTHRSAVNFIRTHHAEIAEAVKRLESAERDAATLRKVKAVRDEWARDAREHLNTFGQHLPASVECLVEQFDAATQEGEG